MKQWDFSSIYFAVNLDFHQLRFSNLSSIFVVFLLFFFSRLVSYAAEIYRQTYFFSHVLLCLFFFREGGGWIFNYMEYFIPISTYDFVSRNS